MRLICIRCIDFFLFLNVNKKWEVNFRFLEMNFFLLPLRGEKKLNHEN